MHLKLILYISYAKNLRILHLYYIYAYGQMKYTFCYESYCAISSICSTYSILCAFLPLPLFLPQSFSLTLPMHLLLPLPLPLCLPFLCTALFTLWFYYSISYRLSK
ncbi:hypothetical protein V2W45_1395584 [Cenococcum geophilum]